MTLRPTYEELETSPKELATRAVEPNRAERGQGELEKIASTRRNSRSAFCLKV